MAEFKKEMPLRSAFDFSPQELEQRSEMLADTIAGTRLRHFGGTYPRRFNWEDIVKPIRAPPRHEPLWAAGKLDSDELRERAESAVSRKMREE